VGEGRRAQRDRADRRARRLRVRARQDRDAQAGRERECTLPLTGRGGVDRLITDLAVFDLADGAMTLVETQPGVTVDEVRERTEAPFLAEPQPA
jgi:3-oxoacid CoA-transferase subunit B